MGCQPALDEQTNRILWLDSGRRYALIWCCALFLSKQLWNVAENPVLLEVGNKLTSKGDEVEMPIIVLGRWIGLVCCCRSEKGSDKGEDTLERLAKDKKKLRDLPPLQIRSCEISHTPGHESFLASALTYGFDTAKRGTRRSFETSKPLSTTSQGERHAIVKLRDASAASERR